MVSVPVLSKISVSTDEKRSKEILPLMSIPYRKAAAVPAKIAKGVISVSSMGDPKTRSVETKVKL